MKIIILFSKWKNIILLVTFLILILNSIFIPILSSSQTLNPDNFANCFAKLAQQVAPAVVNIRTVKTIKHGHINNIFPFQKQNHKNFKDEQQLDLYDFFYRFFGNPGKPNIPREFKQRSLGSGVIVNKNGYVLTNNHVVADADEIIVALQGGEEFKTEIVGRDQKTDLALIKVKTNKELPELPLGNSDQIRVGDWALAVGNPFGLDSTVTAGIISAKGRVIGAGPYDDFLQTDVSINPGNSGGPLVNINGEVIGINTAIVALGQGISFAIPANIAKEVMNQLRTQGKVIRGWLGVIIQPLTIDLAEKLKFYDTEGVLIADVTKNSPADKAGIIRSDIIVEFNGKSVKDCHSLPKLVADIPVGNKAKIKINREGQFKTITVTIGELKEEKNTTLTKSIEQKPRLGLSLQELSPELAKQLGTPTKKGLVITDVENDSPADKAGLKNGNVILEAAQKTMTKIDDFAALTNKLLPGESILLLVQRWDGVIFVVVKTKENYE